MIKSIKIRNFKNFSEKDIEFSPNVTLIYGDNGRGKTSVLDAISYMWNIQSKNNADTLLKDTKPSFFIELLSSENEMKAWFEGKSKKKNFMLDNKKLSAKKFFEQSTKFCYFDPSLMNLFILWPSKRRDYINNVISNCFPWYKAIIKHYNKILKSRNAILWAVFDRKARESEIDYWDDCFCEAATEVYRYRYLFVEFFSWHSKLLKKCTWEKYCNISFEYISKIKFENPRSTLDKYLKDNRKRDIIIQKTHIWPHRDDFSVHIRNISVEKYASRWEMKAIILGLKYIEAKFLEKYKNKTAVFLIDDFSSELDTEHQNTLLSVLSEYQLILTNIHKIETGPHKTKYIHLI
jgi:DNA replication and repair protein RecF